MKARRRFAAALASAVIVAGAVVLGSRWLVPVDAIVLPSVPLAMASEVVPSDAPAPRGGNSATQRYATSKECPAMNNPGGLRWEKTSKAGPFPTDGSVVLPSLGVSAPIVKVGVGMDGKMVVPGNARDVAWLDQGGIPGNTNNVVLAGHINYSRQTGSFSRLRELGKGAPITVEMGGKHYRYRVVWNCFFDRHTNAAAQIMGKTIVPSVTLISCGGVFDSSARTHTQRIAVRAEMIPVATPKPASVKNATHASPTPTPAPRGGGLLDPLRR